MTDELETTRTLLAAAQVEIARLAKELETARANNVQLNGAVSIALLWFLDNGRLEELPEKLRPLYDAAVERAAVKQCGAVSKSERGVPDVEACAKPSGHGGSYHQSKLGGAVWPALEGK